MSGKSLIKSTSEQVLIAKSVDAKGTRCPVPLLRAKQALKAVSVGEYVEVLATDPSAKSDFDAMLKHLPHELVDYSEGASTPRVDRFVILKGE